MKIILNKYWKHRNRFRAEENKLRAEGNKLRAEGYKLWAEGDKLLAEGTKLRAEGNLIYINAVIDYFGFKSRINWDTGVIIPERRTVVPLGEFYNEKHLD